MGRGRLGVRLDPAQSAAADARLLRRARRGARAPVARVRVPARRPGRAAGRPRYSAITGSRGLTGADMLFNTATPDVEVAREPIPVRVDGREVPLHHVRRSSADPASSPGMTGWRSICWCVTPGSSRSTTPAPRARAVAVHHGRVLAVDDERGARQRRDRRAGRRVVPGFHDAHNHMAWFGRRSPRSTCGSHRPRHALRAVAPRAATLPRRVRVGAATTTTRSAGTRTATRWTAPPRAPGGAQAPLRARVRGEQRRARPRRRARRVGGASRGGVVVRDESGEPTGLLQEQAQDRRARWSSRTRPRPVRAIGRPRPCTRRGPHPRDRGRHRRRLDRASPRELAAYQQARDDGDAHRAGRADARGRRAAPGAGHASTSTGSGWTWASAPGSATTGCASGR